jgi:hypothetical protein
VTFGSATLEVEDVEIASSHEVFNDYTLADGTLVKVKSVLTRMSKVVGQMTPEGKPAFIVSVTPVVEVL